MKVAFACFLIACIATAPVTALERTENVITMDDEEAGLCKAGGGCFIVSRAVLLKMLAHERAEGAAEAKGCNFKDRT